jgi:hypothetical protein
MNDGAMETIYMIKQLYILKYDVGFGCFFLAWSSLCYTSLVKISA